MSTDRAAILNKAFKVLKKHYKPVAPNSSATILEHLLFASCLEGAKHDAAEEAYAILQQKYFDWNEVRVTAIGELAEVLSALPDPPAAAKRVRGVLQSLFEAHYKFDFEFLRKQNQGKSVKDLSQHKRITPFVVNYVVQCGLGGHSIPLSEGAFEVLYIIGAISEKDLAAKKAPGLERTISKKQGVEFGSLLHQLGTDFQVSRHSTRVRSILLEIAPDCKERLPKRGGKKVEPQKTTTTKAATKEAATKEPAPKKAPQQPAEPKAAAKKATKKTAAPKATKATKKTAKKAASPTKATKTKTAKKAKTTTKKAATKKAATKKAATKKAAKAKTTKAAKKTTKKKTKAAPKKTKRVKKPR